MMRRLSNVAAVLSLLVALLLGIAGFAYTPGQWWHIAGTINIEGGVVWVSHLGIPLVVLAMGFTLFPLAWGLVLAHGWGSRGRARGFPIEPIQK